MPEEVKKLVRDGKVAVLVSRGYGAGWSSWSHNDQLLFDPDIVEMVLEKCSEDEIKAVAEDKYGCECFDGADGLEVEWIPVGTKFKITEYDGAESIEYMSDFGWTTA